MISRLTIRSIGCLWLITMLLLSFGARAQDTIKVGILHSLTGTMAISESSLKDVMLMLIEEQNRKGGLLGRQLEPVVVDPESDWPLFAEKAQELIQGQQVAAVFGCWTSVSRKSVLPVFQRTNSLLFYPVQYEGQESERNVFYTGATPNQQAIPAIEYLRDELGIERWVLLGTDYIYPRTTNEIIENFLLDDGFAPEDIMINYTPFGHQDWAGIIDEVRAFASQNKKTAIVSTINGDANSYFYQELTRMGVFADQLPVMAFSIGEAELAQMNNSLLEGHFAAWNYFMSIETPENTAFIEQWREFSGSDQSVTNDPMEAHYIGFNLWIKAVEKAGTTESDAVIDSIVGLSVPNLSGGFATMMPNHHITKQALIGRIGADGQFDIVDKSKGAIIGDAWSNYLWRTRDYFSYWQKPLNCGKYDSANGECLVDSSRSSNSQFQP